MSSQWSADDDRLMAALDEALRAVREVPQHFIEAGKAAYGWRTIDAELAALTYDSAYDRPAALHRAEPASLRALSFQSTRLAIELQVVQGGLTGQLVPPQDAAMEVHHMDGDRTEVPVDQVGAFVVRPLPPGPFRLWCRTDDATVLTDWLTL